MLVFEVHVFFKILTKIANHFNTFATQHFLLKRFLFILLFQFSTIVICSAQAVSDTTAVGAKDSVAKKDTTSISLVNISKKDSVSKRPPKSDGWTMKEGVTPASKEFSWMVLEHHPYFGFAAPVTTKGRSEIKQFTGKELLFYLIVLLLIIYALLRMTFPKYFIDLFRLFFRTTLKQRQIKEQLMQTPLPSLLLNCFFVVSGGLYITFLIQHYNFSQEQNFWLLFFYCCIGLSAAYFLKFIGLKVSGWLFNVEEAANSYIFIVFVVNKMMGILLLPFLILLAFTMGNVYTGGLTISWCIVGALLIYRFILTYSAIHNEVKVNLFHFFLYLCAFEIAPLLLVYKGLLLFFHQTA